MSTKQIDIYEVVKKLIGPIRPVGETNADNKSFENLKIMGELVKSLVGDIDSVSYDFKDDHQYSVKKAAEYADEILNQLGITE